MHLCCNCLSRLISTIVGESALVWTITRSCDGNDDAACLVCGGKEEYDRSGGGVFGFWETVDELENADRDDIDVDGGFDGDNGAEDDAPWLEVMLEPDLLNSLMLGRIRFPVDRRFRRNGVCAWDLDCRDDFGGSSTEPTKKPALISALISSFGRRSDNRFLAGDRWSDGRCSDFIFERVSCFAGLHLFASACVFDACVSLGSAVVSAMSVDKISLLGFPIRDSDRRDRVSSIDMIALSTFGRFILGSSDARPLDARLRAGDSFSSNKPSRWYIGPRHIIVQ